MNTLDGLYFVQDLARSKQALDSHEQALVEQLQEPIPLRKVKEVEHEPVDPQKKYVVLAFSELILAVLINKTLNFLLSFFANGGMTLEQYTEAGYIGYRNITLIWPVGAVLALPVALIVTNVIMQFLRNKGDKQYGQQLVAKQQSEHDNVQIEIKNQEIRQHNEQVRKKIQAVRYEQESLLLMLRNHAPWYPEAFFTLDAVNYAIEQIQTGKAKTVNEAMTQFAAEN